MPILLMGLASRQNVRLQKCECAEMRWTKSSSCHKSSFRPRPGQACPATAMQLPCLHMGQYSSDHVCTEWLCCRLPVMSQLQWLRDIHLNVHGHYCNLAIEDALLTHQQLRLLQQMQQQQRPPRECQEQSCALGNNTSRDSSLNRCCSCCCQHWAGPAATAERKLLLELEPAGTITCLAQTQPSLRLARVLCSLNIGCEKTRWNCIMPANLC